MFLVLRCRVTTHAHVGIETDRPTDRPTRLDQTGGQARRSKMFSIFDAIPNVFICRKSRFQENLGNTSKTPLRGVKATAGRSAIMPTYLKSPRFEGRAILTDLNASCAKRGRDTLESSQQHGAKFKFESRPRQAPVV